MWFFAANLLLFSGRRDAVPYGIIGAVRVVSLSFS